MRNRSLKSGQTSVEYAMLAAGVVFPVIFALVYTAQLLWVWHSVVDFTRDGARYAATHCWQSGGDNVVNYMRANVPPMIDMDQFQNGQVDITASYSSRDPATGTLTDFTCDGGDCSVNCVPDVVTVSVTGYSFTKFFGYLGLPPLALPDFRTTVPVESAGCDPEQGTCLP